MVQAASNSPIAFRCVWPDYQPIKADMEVDPIIHAAIDSARDALMYYGISRITLINDVIYPFTNVARDVLKFEPGDIKRLNKTDKQDFFKVTQDLAEKLMLDPQVPSQAVMWNNDIYILMSTRAAMLRQLKGAN